MSLDKPMGYKPLLLALILVCSLSLKAQIRHYDPSSSSTVPVMGVNGNLGITGVGDDYDVKYYRLEAYINPDSTTKYIRGKLTTYYETQVSGFNLLKLDFRNNMIVDSIYYRGSKLAGASYTKDADTLKITLTTRPANYMDSVSIFYRGVPDIGPSSTGFVRSTHGSSPVKNYIYTLSEPYSARNWWPCKLDVRDKADSLDLIMMSPSAFMTAGNGSLVSNTVTGLYRTMVWKHRYPIPAYLVAIAVARYSVITSPNVTISGTSMPVFHYVFPEHNTATAKTTLEKVRPMLTAMSAAFGDYPFKNEKYGHYEFGFSGGMEHSTFSGMNWGTFDQSTDWTVIAHELGHQWFGDKVTCGSWKDIWVNEGFAKFSELIAAENIGSIGSPTLATHRSNIKSNAVASTLQTTYRNDTTSLGTIFSPSVYIYDRGAMILNMLRATLGDEKFFTALRNYTSDPLLAYKNAVTADVKRHMENVSGLNLTDFFNDWIYNNGHATYNISYGFSTNYVGIRAIQSRTSGSTASYFDMPLQFRVSNSTRDTIITMFDNDGVLNLVKDGTMTNWGSNSMGVRLSFTPTSIVFDPNSQVLATSSALVVNATLPIRKVLLSGKSSSSKNILSVDASFTGVIQKLILERSIDGKNFDDLNTVKSPEAKESFVMNMEDANPTFSDLYYRVKLIMSDGEIGYSNIIKLSNQEVSGDIVIYPNAATDYFNVAVKSNTEKVQVKIYTQDGKLKETRHAIGKNILVKFNCVSWTKGFYLVEIHDGSTIQRRKLLIH
jgi:hypothetical protein